MKVSALTAYVDQKNRWNAIFNGKQYEFQSKFGRQEIAGMLDSDLSPENLTCDGELPRAEVARRYKELMTAARQLKKYDPEVKFYEYETEI
jgi:hypothetical protein